MALARWQRTITTGGGIIVPGASVEVRRESDNVLATLFSDRAGTVVIGNPFAADSEGFAAFHVIGGVYKITATFGSSTRVWRYVGVGTMSEFDVEQLVFSFANFPDLSDATVVGRPFGSGTGDPVIVTAAQLQAIYNSVGGPLGGVSRTFALSATPTTLTTAQCGMLIINFNATRTANLPTPSAGAIFAFMQVGSGSLTVDTPGAEVVLFPDGSSASSIVLTAATGGGVILFADGGNWMAFGADLGRPLASTTFAGVGEYATAAEYRANTPLRTLDNNDVWAAADYVGLTDAATIAVDMSTGFNFSVTLGGNRTLGNPTATKNGQAGAILVTQDGTGSRTLAYGANWDFQAGAAPVLSTAIGARDALFYQVVSSTSILITGVGKLFS